jgi:hypothetical protein
VYAQRTAKLRISLEALKLSPRFHAGFRLKSRGWGLALFRMKNAASGDSALFTALRGPGSPPVCAFFDGGDR